MELTLGCVMMRSMCLIHFFETLKAAQNATLSAIGIGWHVKTHINWFDKTIDITKFKAKPPPISGRKMKKIREAQESIWINKTLAKVKLDYDNDNGCVYSMICDAQQALLKDPSFDVGQYKFFLKAQICMQSSNDLQSSV